MTMSSLMKLQLYNESDSEEEKSQQMRLPLPDFVENSTIKKVSLPEVNKEGKVRNFPHESGNWATYVYIPVDSFELASWLDSLVEFFKPLDLKLVDDFHISLTKTVVLRYHWIADFVNSVKNNLREMNSFKIHLFGLKVYINEQKTRSFLSLRVNEGNERLNYVVGQLRNSFEDYNLEGFYEDPSFHVSLLWCPGDKFREIEEYVDVIPAKLNNFDLHVKVSHCMCVTGNKKFTFNFH